MTFQDYKKKKKKIACLMNAGQNLNDMYVCVWVWLPIYYDLYLHIGREFYTYWLLLLNFSFLSQFFFFPMVIAFTTSSLSLYQLSTTLML